jgi:hypothetical protein
MDRRLSLPTFSKAPETYTRGYFDDLTRMLNNLVTMITTPGVGRQSTLVLTDLPSNDSGLEPGSIFVVNGILRIPLLYSPYVAGLSGTGVVGSVSVTTA